MDGINSGSFPKNLERIEVVEISEYRAERLQQMLSELSKTFDGGNSYLHPEKRQSINLQGQNRKKIGKFGENSESHIKLFVAMPFSDDYSDVWDIAITEACQHVEIGVERIDETSFVGDITTQIRSRIRNGSGVIALLDGANPNVFLEIGFSWGASKPTVLMARKGSTIPFDIRNQKCIYYTSINNLREQLKVELAALKQQGIFGSRT